MAGFRFLDNKEHENTTANKKTMLVYSQSFAVTVTNNKLRLMSFGA
jgi:hypothetical protein